MDPVATGLTVFVNRFTARGRTLHAKSPVATGGCGPHTIVPRNLPIVTEFEGFGSVPLTIPINQAPANASRKQ